MVELLQLIGLPLLLPLWPPEPDPAHIDTVDPPLPLPLLPPLPPLVRPPEPVVPGAAGLHAMTVIESNPAARADVVFVIKRISLCRCCQFGRSGRGRRPLLRWRTVQG